MGKSRNTNITPKQECFAREYVKHFNGTQAAIDAGYSKKSAKTVASQNLVKPQVQEYIAGLMKQRNDSLEIDAKYVLKRLIDQDQAKISDLFDDQGALKSVHDFPEVFQRGLIDGIETVEIFEHTEDGGKVKVGETKKVKLANRMTNLTLLGRHTDVQAWLDRTEVTGDLTLSERMKTARERKQGKKP